MDIDAFPTVASGRYVAGALQKVENSPTSRCSWRAAQPDGSKASDSRSDPLYESTCTRAYPHLVERAEHRGQRRRDTVGTDDC